MYSKADLLTSQFEIVFNSARFNSQFKVKESFKLLLAIKVKNTDLAMNHILAAKRLLNLSGRPGN